MRAILNPSACVTWGGTSRIRGVFRIMIHCLLSLCLFFTDGLIFAFRICYPILPQPVKHNSKAWWIHSHVSPSNRCFFHQTQQLEFCLTFICPQDPFSKCIRRIKMLWSLHPQKVSLNTTITAKSAISSWGFFVKQDSDFYVELHSFLNHILTWGPGDPHTWLSCHSLLLLSGLTHSCWLLVTWVWVFINL